MYGIAESVYLSLIEMGLDLTLYFSQTPQLGAGNIYYYEFTGDRGEWLDFLSDFFDEHAYDYDPDDYMPVEFILINSQQGTGTLTP